MAYMQPLTKKRILLIEDDPVQMMAVRDYLTNLGYLVLEASDGESGLQSALNNLPDMILVDWILPRRSGADICKQLRDLGNQTPIVLLTAKNDLDSQVGGLQVGADDYWTKPLPLRLLQAKLEALLRRRQKEQQSTANYQLGKATFDPANARLSSEGHEVELNPKEAGILKLLLLNEGVPVNRDRMLASVWGFNNLPNSRTVDNYVVSLRKKLESIAGKEVTIETKRNLGYLIVRVPSVAELSPEI
ncbi:MAG TPA: response regulator transcription factor [Verrucomicrobiae bacterium]